MVEVLFEVPDDTVAMKMGKLSSQRYKVMCRAANRAATTAKTAIARETPKNYLVTGKEVNKALKVTKATYGKTTAKLTYRGVHRNLYHYRARGKSAVSPETVISWRGGWPNVEVYKARVKADSAFKPLGNAPRAFVQRIKGDSKDKDVVALFRRKTDDPRAPLEGVSGPSIPQIIDNKEIRGKAQGAAAETYLKRMDKEIDNVVRGRA